MRHTHAHAGVEHSATTPLLHVKMQLSMVTHKLRADIAEDDLVALLKSKYKDQVFMRGQTFAVDLYGKAVRLLILSCTVVNPDAKESQEFKESKTMPWFKAADFGRLVDDTTVSVVPEASRYLTWRKSATSDADVPDLFRPEWRFEDMGIGGLDKEFQDIFRRAFASRLFPSSVIAQLGIKHVRGTFSFFFLELSCVLALRLHVAKTVYAMQ